MIIGAKCYSDILKDEFEDRVSANTSYSMRAFARDVSFSPSTMSAVLNKKQGLSVPAAKKLAESLQFSDEETKYIIDLVLSKHSKCKTKRSLAKIRLNQYQSSERVQLQNDALQATTHWYFFAILELTYLDGFKSSVPWIAKSLGITKKQASNAIDVLFRLGLLTKHDGHWVDANLYLATSDGSPSKALKTLNAQTLNLALAALESQDIEDRHISSLMLSFDTSRTSEAFEDIKKFKNKFNKKYTEGERKNSVYCLGVQLFQLDRRVK